MAQLDAADLEELELLELEAEFEAQKTRTKRGIDQESNLQISASPQPFQSVNPGPTSFPSSEAHNQAPPFPSPSLQTLPLFACPIGPSSMRIQALASPLSFTIVSCQNIASVAKFRSTAGTPSKRTLLFELKDTKIKALEYASLDSGKTTHRIPDNLDRFKGRTLVLQKGTYFQNNCLLVEPAKCSFEGPENQQAIEDEKKGKKRTTTAGNDMQRARLTGSSDVQSTYSNNYSHQSINENTNTNRLIFERLPESNNNTNTFQRNSEASNRGLDHMESLEFEKNQTNNYQSNRTNKKMQPESSSKNETKYTVKKEEKKEGRASKGFFAMGGGDITEEDEEELMKLFG